MNVVNFPPRGPKEGDEKVVWACLCGCISFELHADGTTECCGCGNVSAGPPDAAWRRLKPKTPADPPEMEVPERSVARFNTGSGALRKVMAKMNVEETAFVIVAQREGPVSTWNGEEYITGDAVWWLDEKLTLARSMLLPEGAAPRSLDMIRAHITNSDELHSVAVIRQDGDITVWLSAQCRLETPEQTEWLQRKLETVRELLVNDPPKETP